MGQYTVSLIKNRPILIDAGEAGWIKEHGSEDNLWADINPQPELERRLRLVYGCFIVNPSQVTGSLNPKSLHVMRGMEMAYIHFEPKENRFYAWRSLMIVDLEMLDGHTKSDRLAFAAVVDMADEVPRTKDFSLGAFPYNRQLSVQQNIITRLGVLAINDEDRRKQRKLPNIDWRLLINKPRAWKAADRVQYIKVTC